MVHPAAFHPLTPGNPAYAVLKVGAIGSLVGLRVALARRSKSRADDATSVDTEHDVVPAPAERHRAEHPVSRRKARRRRRSRR